MIYIDILIDTHEISKGPFYAWGCAFAEASAFAEAAGMAPPGPCAQMSPWLCCVCTMECVQFSSLKTQLSQLAVQKPSVPQQKLGAKVQMCRRLVSNVVIFKLSHSRPWQAEV